MPTITTLTDPTAIAQLDGPPSASSLDSASVSLQAPDLHLAVEGDGEKCAARCSLWWTDTPDHEEHAVGLVGHYAAADAAAGQAVLDRACRRLADEGCMCAIGPMDGATWYPYRFVTERGDRPPFVLEPWHPASYPEHFRDAGFEPLAQYVSAVGADRDTLQATSVPDRPPVDDVYARSLNPDRFEAELRRLHPLVTTSFADNFLYTPLPEADFVALHRPYRSVLEPEFVHLLEQERAGGRRLVGVAFMVPNVVQSKTTSSLPLGAQSETTSSLPLGAQSETTSSLPLGAQSKTTSSLPLGAQSETTSSLPFGAQSERDEEIDTAVLKTMAVHPDLMGQGLGRWMTERVHAQARARDYRQVIHALMHEDNVSRNLGHGAPLRRYTLYRRTLS